MLRTIFNLAKYKGFILLIVLTVCVVGLSSCETMEGAGHDIENEGEIR